MWSRGSNLSNTSTCFKSHQIPKLFIFCLKYHEVVYLLFTLHFTLLEIYQECALVHIWLPSPRIGQTGTPQKWQKVQTLAPFSPPHSRSVTAWSGWECRIVCFGRVQNLLDQPTPQKWPSQCFGGKGFQTLFNHTKSTLAGAYWHLKTRTRRPEGHTLFNLDILTDFFWFIAAVLVSRVNLNTNLCLLH